MSQPAPDHRRMIAERNIEAILDAAERLLERRTQPTIAAVAREAGLSRVTVYSHFLNLEALLEAVVARTVERTMATLDEAEPERGTPLVALQRLIAVAWQRIDRNRGMAQAAMQQLRPDAFARAHEAAHRRIRDLVERGRQDGSFRTDLPTEWLVTSSLALIHAAAEDVHADRTDAASALTVLTATIRDLFVGPQAAS